MNSSSHNAPNGAAPPSSSSPAAGADREGSYDFERVVNAGAGLIAAHPYYFDSIGVGEDGPLKMGNNPDGNNSPAIDGADRLMGHFPQDRRGRRPQPPSCPSSQLPFPSGGGGGSGDAPEGCEKLDRFSHITNGGLPSSGKGAAQPIPLTVPSGTDATIISNGIAPGTPSTDNRDKAASAGTAASGVPNMFHGKGSFPLNLTLMLESVESMNLSHLVSWVPSGQSFVIHNPDQFLALVLPKFFKSSKNTKIRSFYRKLNRWGFSILRNHHLMMGMGTTKGVWHHPGFYRSRAIECLKLALETGDTGSFLSISHGRAEGASETTKMTLPGPVSAGSPLVETRRRSSETQSSQLQGPAPFSGGVQTYNRMSHRESDFSLGDDSLGPSQNMPFLQGFPQSHDTLPPQAQSMAHNPAAAPHGSNLSRSFSGARDPSLMHQQTLTRRSVNYSIGSSALPYRPYQPVTQAGESGNRDRRTGVAASWTAGTGVSTSEFIFPSPYPFNISALGQEQGQGQYPLLGNSNVDIMQQFAAIGSQNQLVSQEGNQQEPQETTPPEDLELATFFEKFAESLKK